MIRLNDESAKLFICACILFMLGVHVGAITGSDVLPCMAVIFSFIMVVVATILSFS